jgi:hypothetical protein
MTTNTYNLIRLFSALTVLILCVSTGCSFCQTKRGHLIRCEWAIEHNRVPWIGCPPTSGYDDDEDGDDGKSCGLMECLKGGKDGRKRGFRWHCGRHAECTAQQPCCKTLGCGMWIDPNEPQSFAQLGGGAKACGLTPFCSPMKPCGLTPQCGKPAAINVNPQMFLTNRGNTPAGQMPFGGQGTIQIPPQAMQMQGALVTKGIVPGISTVSTGGVVSAIGVSTPSGTMTASGLKMPNGVVNPNVVLRACTMSPNCTAAHPCGLVPGCGTAVPLAMVSNNATVLASALMAQGSASGVVQAGTMVNPITNQPVSGLTMNGNPQAGYPPIGYSPTGYSPGYPRFDGNTPVEEEEEPAAEEPAPGRQSQMPVPRFYPIPTKPVFQRSEGIKKVSSNERRVLDNDDKELDTALDEAYLQGVSAAMNEVEREMALQRQAANKRRLQATIAQQTQMIQQNLAANDELPAANNELQVASNVRREAVKQYYPPARVANNNPQSVNNAVPRQAAMLNYPQTAVAVEDKVVDAFKSAFASVNKFLEVKPQTGIASNELRAINNPQQMYVPSDARQLNVPYSTPPVRTVQKPKKAVPDKAVAQAKVKVPAKPQTFTTPLPLGLESEAESVALIQQAQYERELPKP